MADSNSNGNSELHGRYLALDERVTNIRTSMTNLESEMQRGFSALNSHLTALSNEFRNSSKTQWPVIWSAAGVIFGILVGIGGILYVPMKADVSKLQESTISRNEWETAVDRGTENRKRQEDAIIALSNLAVRKDQLELMAQEYRDYKLRIDAQLISLDEKKLNRNEWVERNNSRDHDIENLRQAQMAAVANLQRQIDQQAVEFRDFSGSLGNGRDVIQRLQSEYDRLRDQLSDIRSAISRDRETSLPPMTNR